MRAHQHSGSIDLKAGIARLVTSSGIVPAFPAIGQLNTGREITSAQSSASGVSSYSTTTS